MDQSGTGRWCRIALALTLALVAGARLGRADTGGVTVLPNDPMKPPTYRGLRLTVDYRGVQGFGYRPVTIDVASTPPAPADRTLSVELQLAYWNPEKPFITLRGEIELPAGSAGARRTFSLPQLSNAQYFKLKVFEEGTKIDELSIEQMSIQSGPYARWDNELTRILFVADQPPDVSQLSFLASSPYQAKTQIQFPANVPSFATRTAAELRENWLDYSALDVVAISLHDLKEMAARRPAAWRALRAWTHSGGNLCVFGAGDAFQGLEELEQLVGWAATEKEKSAPYRGWEPASNRLFEEQVVPAAQAYAQNQANAPAAGGVNPPAAAPAQPAGKGPAPPKPPPFVWKPVAFGAAAALADDNPFPGDELGWRWVFASLGANRTRWHMREGSIPDQENPQFNDFLIADVGLPPIRAYRVLITLFVVAIGPVNYWLLRRRGRLYLFLFTVPAAALVTSAALLGYALVADGLESRLRSRSLTHLDQRSGESVSRARLSYYVGLAPSGGLAFSQQTAVTPLELDASPSPFQVRNRVVDWDTNQHLTRGWLGSRMPTQFVTTRAHQSQRKLAIVPGGDPARLTVKNQLGMPIRQLLCCDATGKLHLGESLARDQQSTLAAISGAADIDSRLLKFSLGLTQNGPAFPASASPFESRGGGWFFMGRPRMYYNQQTSADTALSVLESELARIKAAVLSQTLDPGTYVAIVDRPAEIEAGTDGLAESQSLHVICGRW